MKDDDIWKIRPKVFYDFIGMWNGLVDCCIRITEINPSYTGSQFQTSWPANYLYPGLEMAYYGKFSLKEFLPYESILYRCTIVISYYSIDRFLSHSYFVKKAE